MNKIEIAGLKIDAISKQELLDAILKRLQNGQKTFIITPYSEFLYRSLRDQSLLDIFNQADFAPPDGIGIFWAKKYLDLPLSAKGYWTKILQALWQAKYTLAAVIFWPRWIKRAFPEKIAGADLIWDLAELAAKNNLSIFLLGGFGDTPQKAALALNTKHLALKMAGWSNKNPDDPSTIEDINHANPDILLVAYGPVKQEKWIAENLPKLNVKLAIGLGGTFDYIAGKQSSPPKSIRSLGLEWFYRLLTQPRRLKRILNATFGLMSGLWHYKVFMGYPLRKNGVAVVLNKDKKVFVARKARTHVDIIKNNSLEKWQNYWQFPQGGIEEGEDAAEAIAREFREETGVKEVKFLGLSKKTNSYVWNNALRGFWHNRDYRFSGQTQQIAYFTLAGDDDKIILPPKEEFADHRWVDAAELDKVIHQEKINLAKIAQEDLKEMAEKGIIN
jgi:N-acetylglucosaminyldiphosphoundecaprenol N-acetyl-beta-D-mannosaminyltransferase